MKSEFSFQPILKCNHYNKNGAERAMSVQKSDEDLAKSNNGPPNQEKNQY